MSEVSTMTDNRTLTDLELDARLARLFKQHGKAGSDMRGKWHDLAMDVLAEQKRRRDEWLGVGVANLPVTETVSR